MSQVTPAGKMCVRILSSLCFALVPISAADAAPQAELWPRWTAHNEQSTSAIDHSAWAQFLDAYLVTDTSSGVNLLRYGEVTATDVERLRSYVDMLESVRVSDLSRPEQFAYWVNLYNAFTVQLVLENHPVDSIREIGGLLDNGPWDAKQLNVEGVALSLNDIEHRILRPIWQDPRIHYAVNCASMSCPNLQPEPFSAGNSERLLERGARSYIRHSRGARIEGSTLVLSSIYEWYEADFGGSLEGVLDHLRAYADPELRRALANPGTLSVRYEYDWSLNEPNE